MEQQENQNIHQNETFSPVHVEKYDPTGYGIGTACRIKDGFEFTSRLFGTIDGEVVRFEQAVRSKKGVGIRDGIKIEILQESPKRVVPKCAHFGTCGGCVWQHISPTYQKEIKNTFIQHLFQEKIDPSLSSSIQFLPILGVDDKNASHFTAWEYRNKMEFSFAQDRQNRRFLGLYDRLGRGVVSLKECHLVSPWISEGLHIIQSWWEEKVPHLQAFHPSTGSGTLRTVTFREAISTGDRMVILTVSSKPEYAPSKSDLASFQEVLQKLQPNSNIEAKPTFSVVLRIHQAIPKCVTQIYEMILEGPDYIRERVHAEVSSEKKITCTFHISPQAFFQPNTNAASYIYSEALKMANISSDDVVYDLYCGTGTFGMFAAHLAKKVIAIEISKDAAYDAKTNADRLGLSNFHIHTGDVTEVLEKLPKETDNTVPIVLIDPPRSGLYEKAIKAILSLAPKRIVYISCNPVNQVRDIQMLTRQGSYTLSQVRPIDQFPQTPHVENLVLLEKKTDTINELI